MRQVLGSASIMHYRHLRGGAARAPQGLADIDEMIELRGGAL
jgi:hypothetical protein